MADIGILADSLRLSGVRTLLLSMKNYSNPTVWFTREINESDLEFVISNQIEYRLADEPKFLIILVSVLVLFLPPLKTTNYFYGRLRDLYFEPSKVVRCIKYLSNFLPKILNSNKIVKIIAFFYSFINNRDQLQFPDKFLFVGFFTKNLQLLELARQNGSRIICLIYSWDNPYKYNFLPSLFDEYWVWNEYMGEDIHRLHKIPKDKIKISGAIQFDYLLSEYKYSSEHPTIKFVSSNVNNYYLFLFSSSYNAVHQEIELLRLISNNLKEVGDPTHILVRPYPNIKDKGIYDSIKSIDNIYFDTSVYDTTDDYHLFVKKEVIDKCKVVINIVTTMALEAAVLNKLIIQLAFAPFGLKNSKKKFEYLDLNSIMKNDHLNRYLFLDKYPNVVRSECDFKNLMHYILSEDYYELMKFTTYLSNFSVQTMNKKSLEIIKTFLCR
ncbi:MAG: hypothetical protein HUU54_01370 [Ignavibacteriaceae bacterium]|nr:hypothetical protein [Ignavibacteriaceae bacterium]